MQRFSIIASMLIHISLAILPGGLHGGEPNAEISVPSTSTELVDAIRKVLTETKTPGVGLAIANRDEILISEGIGLANVESHQPVTPQTMFRAGSISKSFTALALLKLQEAGQVTLDVRIGELVPEVHFANRWEESAPLKLVHVLEHTSGFDEIPLSQFAVSVPAINLRDSVQFDARPHVVRWQPGTFFSYSNANYTLAGYVVEKVSGRDFDEYLAQEILQPLDMSEASFLLTDYVQEHIATGYGADGISARAYEHIVGRSSGALNCTPTQLGHLVQMLLNRGSYAGQQLLTADSVERMETPTTSLTAQYGIKNGYGLANYTSSHQGYRFHGHNGAVDGFLASYAYAPDFGVGYAFMINSSNGNAFDRIESIIQSYVSREWPKAVTDIPQNARPEQWSRFDGFYEPFTLRIEGSRFLDRLLMLTRIKATSKGLEIGGLFGKPELYVPTELEGGFRRTVDQGTTVLFLDRTGQTIMASGGLGRHGNLRRLAGWQFWGQACCIGYCLLAMFSSLLLSVVWVPLWLFRRTYNWKQLVVRLLPAMTVLSLLSFLAVVFHCLDDPIVLLAKPTVWSISIVMLTYLFAALTIFSLCLVVLLRQSEDPRWIWWHSCFVSVANGLLLTYMLYWGIIGARTWA